MLTALLEDKLIHPWNYSEEFLKKASDSKQLKCPECGQPLTFKECSNKQSHFSHLHSDCVKPFSEPESIEHETGKRILFDWLKNQFDPNACFLEKKIVATNQEADLFVGSNLFVFEFQCSVIQSKTWEERSRLYRSAALTDFWILGYSMHKYCYKDDIISHKINPLEEMILNVNDFIPYLDVLTKQFVILRPIKRYSNLITGIEYFYTPNEIILKDGRLKFKDEHFFNLQKKRRNYLQTQQERAKKANFLMTNIKKQVEFPGRSLATQKQINYIKYLLNQKNITIPYKLHGLTKNEANAIIQDLISSLEQTK